MEIKVRTGQLHTEDRPLIVVSLFEGAAECSGATDMVDKALHGQIRRLMREGDITGQARETALIYTAESIPALRVLVVGLGKEESFGLEAIRIASATAAQRVRELKLRSFGSMIHGAGWNGLPLEDAAQAVVEGAELALYQFRELKSSAEDDPKPVVSLALVVPDAHQVAAAQEGAAIGQHIAAAANLARDLVNRPSNHATPAALARHAQAMAGEPGMTCTVLDEAEMAALGMGSLLGVAQGSDEPAKFIILEYNAGREHMDTLALVGKGITFDSGGISLKAAQKMQGCKGDMAGAAAVLEAMRVAARLQLPLHIVGLIPSTENMPSGKACKPGDVVRAMNGKTIEVVNTDAEGRLILADALAYALRYRPQAIIDLATLTNAIAVALGHQAAGLFSNDDDLAARLDAAGRTSHERVWRLPLFEEYRRQLKSDVADLKNCGSEPAGAITAAVFLQQFVDDLPWAHLDIAGRAFASTDEDEPFTPYSPSMATGFGVRLLVQFLRDWVNSPPHRHATKRW